MKTKQMLTLAAAIGAIGLTGCQSDETASTNFNNSSNSSYAQNNYNSTTMASSKLKAIECGQFIRSVMAGNNYDGQEFVVHGVALNSSIDGRVNVGTRSMFREDECETFVSVFDVPMSVKPGSKVKFNIKVDSTYKGSLPSGEAFVVVDAEYID